MERKFNSQNSTKQVCDATELESLTYMLYYMYTTVEKLKTMSDKTKLYRNWSKNEIQTTLPIHNFGRLDFIFGINF